MSPAPAGTTVTTPTDTTAVLTRSFNAPKRLVWEAFFNPDKMKRWMLPPPGWTLKSIQCEAKTGGILKLSWTNEAGDASMTLSGTFTEVEPGVRAVHTEEFALGDGKVVQTQVEEHAFTEKDGVTELRITQTYPSKEARDEGLGAGEGMEEGYKRLDALLAQGAL